MLSLIVHHWQVVFNYQDQFPQTQENKDYMDKDLYPYASAIGSLTYVMVCIRLDIGHSVGVVSKNISNPGKVH